MSSCIQYLILLVIEANRRQQLEHLRYSDPLLALLKTKQLALSESLSHEADTYVYLNLTGNILQLQDTLSGQS